MNKLPEEIFNQVKDFVIFKPKTKNELQEMVSFYCENKEECIKQCGVINNWDVSNITDMSYLFSDSHNLHIFSMNFLFLLKINNNY